MHDFIERNAAGILTLISIVVGAVVSYVVGPLWVAPVASIGTGALIWAAYWLYQHQRSVNGHA